MSPQENRGTKRPHSDIDAEEVTDKLDLFSTPPSHSQVEGGRWTFHKPTDLNPTASDIKVLVPKIEEEFTDLSNARLIIEYTVLKSDGTPLGDESTFTAYPGDHGDLLFRSAQLRVNGVSVEHSENYGFMGYLQTALSHDKLAKESRLSVEGWFEDQASSKANAVVPAAASKIRRQVIETSKKQTLLLRPKFGLCQQSKIFPPMTEFEFHFRRSNNRYFFNGPNGCGADVSLRINSVELKVRRYKVKSSVYSALSTLSSGGSRDDPAPYMYPYKQLATSENTIGQGTSSHTLNLGAVKRPNKVLVVLLQQSAHSGIETSSCTKFNHCDITQAELKFDGMPTDHEIVCNFTTGDVNHAYGALFDVLFSKQMKHTSHGISKADFINKTPILAWNTQDLIGGTSDKASTVSLSISLKFGTPTPHVVTAIVITETSRRMELSFVGTPKIS